MMLKRSFSIKQYGNFASNSPRKKYFYILITKKHVKSESCQAAIPPLVPLEIRIQVILFSRILFKRALNENILLMKWGFRAGYFKFFKQYGSR